MQSILQIRESTGRLAESRGEVREALEKLSQIAHDRQHPADLCGDTGGSGYFPTGV